MIVSLKTPRTDFIERTDTLKRYYDDIRRYPLLSHEAELRLFEKLKHGTKEEKKRAKSAIINANQRFVVAIAKKFGNNENVLDLISEGNIGLMEAVEKFDASKGVKFSTFAVWYIRRAINVYNIYNGALVMKTNITKTYHVMSQAVNKFVQKEHRQPTSEELKDSLLSDYNIRVKDGLDTADAKFISIDDSSNELDDSQNFKDINLFNNINSSVNNYEDDVESEFNKHLADVILKKLKPIEQEIIKMSFGIGCDREYELNEISEKIGLSKERVRQLKSSSLEKLKAEYGKFLDKI